MKNFIPLRSLALTAVLTGAVAFAYAAPFTSGGIKYQTITEPSGSENGTCKVAWQTQGIEGVVTIPDEVTYNGKTYDVVEIDSYAFNAYDDYYEIEIEELNIGNKVRKIGSEACGDQYYLHKVTMGSAVTEIGAGAFQETGINTIVIPSGVKAIKSNTFYNCNSLRSITLNEGLESIGMFAFSGCRNLQSITIPSTCTDISFSTSAFSNCTNLTAMNVAPGNTAYSSTDGIVYTADGTSLVFSPLGLSTENLTFPSALTAIGSSAFKGNTRLKSVTFPPALTSIGSDAFNGCTGLTSLSFPSTLTTIEEYAFNNCPAVTSLTLNEGLQTIGNSAFKGMDKITTLVIPSTAETVSWSAFSDCVALKSITVAPGSTHYSADGTALIQTANHKLILYATSSPVKSYTIPADVKAIESFSFQKANALEVLNTNNVETIDNDAILQCDNLRDLTIGSSIVSLGNGAVALCNNLDIIRLNSTVIPEIGGSRDPFPYHFAEGGTLYVPDAVVYDYRNSIYWSTLNVQPMSQAPAVEQPVVTVPTAHAYQMGSKDSKWGFVSFPVNDIDALTIDKTTSSSDDQIGAGEYVDGKYYSYTLYYDYIMGDGLEPSNYVIWNADDYTEISSTASTTTGRVVDMAFDYAHNTMYALIEENKTGNGAIGLTALNVIDMATGTATRVGLPGDIRAVNGNGQNVEEHLVALASNPTDGKLYAMGEYRQLYTLDRTTGAATAVGSRNRVAITNDFQSMAFAADGNLYQVQMHPDYEYFMQIDPATGALTNPVTGEAVTVNSDFTNNAARFEHDPQLTGLYFEGKTLVTDVPKSVTSLSASTDPQNPNTVTLSWTLPTQNYDGTPATISSIEVYRFGTSTPIAILGAGATSCTDTEAPNGDVTYYVAACSASHAGFPAWTTVFAGADQLNAVTGLTATLDGNIARLSWNAPTSTVNNGYADYDNITYIVKSVKGSDETVAATGVTAEAFDVTLEGNGTYSFIVIPVSCGIEGISATSNAVTLEGVEQLPYQCGFEDTDGGTLWTIVNNQSSSTYGWSIISGYSYQQLSGKFAQFKTGGSATFPANDWLISPAINCPAGDYKLTFYANGGSYDTHSYKVFMGSDSTDPADFTQEVYSLTDQKVYSHDEATKNYTLVTVNFTLAETGDYRIGFQGIGASTYATLKIDNVTLECTRQSGISGITADAVLSWDAATRTLSCPAAEAIDVYDMGGLLLGHADGCTLRIDAIGAVIVRVTTGESVSVRKLIVK